MERLNKIWSSKHVEVYKELNLAIAKHGLQEDISIEKQYMITGEEFGEIAQAINDGDFDNAQKEINQTIAMLIKLSWLLDKN